MTCTIVDPGAMLKGFKVKTNEHDEFSYVEMTLAAKHKVGGKVTSCILKLGYFVTNPTCTS
jgi:hypothetical protein